MAVAVGFLTGAPRQGRIGVGWRTLQGADTPPATAASLTVLDVDRVIDALETLGGAGVQAARRQLLTDLFGRATEPEQRMLWRVFSGELRQGALDGVMVDAVAKAAAVPVAAVRRAHMMAGDLGVTAAAAMTGGEVALRAVGLQPGRAVQPMLASPAADVAEALAASDGPASVEWKLDGARVQAHRVDGEVSLFTRNLNEVTGRLGAVVALVASLPGGDLVLDGEVLGVTDDGGPRRFQDTMSEFGARGGAAGAALQPFFFDVLHADGRSVVDEPLAVRRQLLASVVPGSGRLPSIVTADADEAAAFLDAAVTAGHEGVMVKALEATYDAGRRGAAWRKVKPVHTFDLVVLAAEWGHGRRTGWLSNLHLGRSGRRRCVRDGRQDLQGDDRRPADGGRPSGSRSWPSARKTATWSTYGPSWSSRSRSTGFRCHVATRAGSHSASPASVVIAPTSILRMPTTSRRAGTAALTRHDRPGRPGPRLPSSEGRRRPDPAGVVGDDLDGSMSSIAPGTSRIQAPPHAGGHARDSATVPSASRIRHRYATFGGASNRATIMTGRRPISLKVTVPTASSVPVCRRPALRCPGPSVHRRPRGGRRNDAGRDGQTTAAAAATDHRRRGDRVARRSRRTPSAHGGWPRGSRIRAVVSLRARPQGGRRQPPAARRRGPDRPALPNLVGADRGPRSAPARRSRGRRARGRDGHGGCPRSSPCSVDGADPTGRSQLAQTVADACLGGSRGECPRARRSRLLCTRRSPSAPRPGPARAAMSGVDRRCGRLRHGSSPLRSDRVR